MNDNKIIDPTKRVLVGMSGGIDSTATCILLLEQGYEVVGVTLQVWSEKTNKNYLQEAAALAERLGLEHHIADEQERFRKSIVGYFIDEYLAGRTPNPCVYCNPEFKFRVLVEWADKLNCAYVATGHYGIIENRNGKYYVVAGKDSRKDQSYFLWRLPQEILKRVLFPLGNYNKLEIREYLHRKGLKAKSKDGESMEVCFIEGDYRDFLKKYVPDIDEKVGKGWYVDNRGVKLGEHKGFPYYTVGQRKGLEIALGEPMYVLKTNPEKNTVMLGRKEELLTRYMLVEEVLAPDPEELKSIEELKIRIRYRSPAVPCKVHFLVDNRLLVEFEEPASAVTPGQSAVFYDGDRVIGGAFIASQKGVGLLIRDVENTAENN